MTERLLAPKSADASSPSSFTKGDSATKRHRQIYYCYFCGGRVVAVGAPKKKVLFFRCEAEGVRWEASENLVLHGGTKGGYSESEERT